MLSTTNTLVYTCGTLSSTIEKKTAPDSARRSLLCENDTSQSSYSNNDTHDAEQLKAEPQVASDDESRTLDTIRHDIFPVPARAAYANSTSTFDEFGLNAAADGLFHPASTIEAFTEHDAKYRHEIKSASDKPRSGPRRARSGSEYPPSRENHRLPALRDSGKAKRLSTRPESKASSSGSAPASMTTTSSLSKLLNADEEKRSLSATQSDSKLYAPRRMDTVPSSADRNALDFLERELESDGDNNLHNSPVANASRSIGELGNNEIPDDSSSAVPPLDFSLARKFDELKRIMKSNREKINSARQSTEQFDNEISPSGFKADLPALASASASASRPNVSSRTDKGSRSSTIRAPSGGSSGTKNVVKPVSGVKDASKKRATPAARATTDMNNGSAGSKRALANHVSGAASRKPSSSVAVARVPRLQSKKEVSVRTGVSLSDLKAEHREALQMLKELGGPVDPDYLQGDADSNASKEQRVGRSASSSTTGMARSSGSTVALVARKSTNQLQSRSSPSTRPTSANSGVSMVTKLRESISSGRNSRESSPRCSSPGETAGSPTTPSGRLESVDAPAGSYEPSSNQTPVQEPASDTTAAPVVADPDAVIGNSLPPASSPNKVSDPWKQYEDDTIDDEDEDNNEQEHDDTNEGKVAPASGDRYSDEDFESDW
ncbi:hypothetical protein PHYPSEUDO_008988 [Phytophthora pseudosyringae]|uniref:Uncharacterized protein n=1 Tax=Phytophthora pseudosyringae TaxID=221518 RepID=A0A8T1W9N7_9STRA|nr:hypothetical protein PHYPSEUDO_008988 [Phytophthora pseudosyringae]